MQKILSRALLGCAAFAISGCGKNRDVPPGRRSATAIADAYLVALAREFPETGTAQNLAGTDHGALAHNTEAGLARWHAYEDSVLTELRGAVVADSERVVAGVLRETLESSVASRVCR